MVIVKFLFQRLYFVAQTPYICTPKIKLIMANHSATKKDVRQSRKRNERNRYYGKTTRNAIRDIRAVEEKSAATTQLPSVASMIEVRCMFPSMYCCKILYFSIIKI
jgi:hypothetical protein